MPVKLSDCRDCFFGVPQILLRVLDTHRTHTHTCRVASACGRMSAMQLTF